MPGDRSPSDAGADGAPPVVGGKRAQAKARTRQAILGAALVVFRDKGFRASAIADIATQAGTSVGAIYTHFSSKDELLLSVVEAESYRELALARDRVAEGGASSAFPDAGSAEVAEPAEWVDTDVSLGARLSAEIWLRMAEDEEVRQRFASSINHRIAMIAEIVSLQRRSRGSVDWPATDAEVAAVALTLREGLVRRRRVHPETIPADLYSRSLRWMIAGLDALAAQEKDEE